MTRRPPAAGVSRRAVLLAGAGTVLSACGADKASTPEAPAERLVSGTFASKAQRAQVGWSIAYPAGHGPGDDLPVVVSLHGRSGDHTTSFVKLRLHRYLDQVVARGTAPFAVASVDGGDHSYWHPRADGTDAGEMVKDEFLPLLADRGLDTRRLGLFGWSMGGYGALLLAGTGGLAVRAVAVSSPALFESAGRTAPGAFDDAADFEAHDVFGNPGWVTGVPLRIACGDRDPFYAASRAFAARLDPRPEVSFGPGAHDKTYWRSAAPAQLRFVGRILSR